MVTWSYHSPSDDLLVRIFCIDAGLKGVTSAPEISLSDRDFPSSGYLELPLHQIKTCNHLSDGMLNLGGGVRGGGSGGGGGGRGGGGGGGGGRGGRGEEMEEVVEEEVEEEMEEVE